MKQFLPLAVLIFALLVTVGGTVAVIAAYPRSRRAPFHDQTVFSPQLPAIRQFDHQARLFVRAGKLREAEQLARKIVRLRPEQSMPQKLLGKILFLRGAYAEAEQLFRRLALLESDDPVVRNNLGEVLIEQGLPQAGLRELLAAEHLSGGEKYIRYNLCVACLLTGRFEAAAEYWRKFLRTKGKRGMPEEAVCSMPLPAGPETEER